MLHENANIELRKGALVRVRAFDSSDEWRLAQVLLISANGNSIALRLEDAVRLPGGGIITGVLALVIDYDRGSATGLFGEEYEIEVFRARRAGA